MLLRIDYLISSRDSHWFSEAWKDFIKPGVLPGLQWGVTISLDMDCRPHIAGSPDFKNTGRIRSYYFESTGNIESDN